MNDKRFTLDTNILVYAIDRDAGERHAKAVELVDRAVDQSCVLTLQALAEFFHAATRKGKMPAEDATAQVHDWQLLFPTIPARAEDLSKAMKAVNRHNLSFWDAMLWATAKGAGVQLLLTEDFQNGRELEGVLFHNPFA